MFFKFVDRSAPKAVIRDALLSIAHSNGEPLSKSRAHNLADKFKRGIFDPDLVRVIQYSDPTGETASANADKEKAASVPALAA